MQERSVAYIIFWGSYWLNNQSKLKADGQLVVNYFHDVGGTSFENILTQYYDASAHIANTESLAGMWVDTSPPPTTTGECIPSRPDIHDSNIRKEIDKAIQTKGWPKNNPNVTYFVYTPRAYLIYADDFPRGTFTNPCNVTSSKNYYCGYHYFSGKNQDNTAYAEIVYPNTYCTVSNSPNKNPAGDSLVNMTAHEQFEAITDPDPPTGWVDSGGQEMGDKCETAKYIQRITLNNGGVFEIQSMYSNASHGCVTSYVQKFQVSPGAVQVNTTVGANPASQTLTIQNSRGTTLNWQVNTGVPSWLTVTPASGSISARSSSAVNLTFDTSQYEPQTLFTALTFSDTQQSISSFQVPITVAILGHSAINNPQLIGIATVSASDVWAVGVYTDSNEHDQTLIEHWDGSSWNVVFSPNPGSYRNQLVSVAAVSANDVWAVGSYDDSSADDQTLIEHWNGSSWSVVPSPNPTSCPSLQGIGGCNYLSSVAVVTANDIWAVGSYYDETSGDNDTLIEHWNGSTWSVVPSPNPTSCPTSGYFCSELSGVAAVSVTDVWAVGDYADSSHAVRTLIEHWNGSAWTVVVASPYGSIDLHGVAAVSATDVWAVGSDGTTAQTEHWNGSTWSVVPSPNPTSCGFCSELSSVAAVATNDVWAVGYYEDSSSVGRTLIEHWDGSTWTVVPSPNPSPNGGGLSSVAAVAPTDVWAIGSTQDSNGNNYTLAEQWNGTSWNVVPGP